ncbi:hypothetical protein BDR05DRAFT_998992 [Suillus weaverae]|nr:hypothetical protein BDR05DRAFT_998992 [Suillus weaverae]
MKTYLHLLYLSQILCQLIYHKQGLFHDLLHGNLPLIFPINLYQWGSIPGLPCNAIAHVQRAHALPPVDYNAHLNEQMNAAQNNRCRQRDVRWRQDRDEIRQQAQAELRAAGMQPPQQPHIHIPNEPVQPAPPAPPVYGAIHYEGAVGPHNFGNPLNYFAPNPAPPFHAPPEPDYHQFNVHFQHHLQAEQMEHERIRNDLRQRQAQEEFHRQQIQLQLQQRFQQQEAERLNREAQYALELRQQEADRMNRQHQDALRLQQHAAERMNTQDQEVLRLQQHEAERMNTQDQDALRLQQHQAEQMNRQDQDIQQVGQQEAEHHRRQQQRVREQEERLEEALREYDDPASQELHHQDEERRRTQEQELRMQRDAENQQHINQVVPIPEGGRPYTEPIILHTLGPLDVECPNCHARHFICEKLTSSPLHNPRFGVCCLQGQVNLPPFPPWPPELQQAYTNQTFISKIRQYNSALALTSVGVNIKDCTLQGSGPNAFRIHGSLHHLMGSLIPPEGIQPSYAQLYIYDPEEATNICATHPGNEGLDHRILRELHDMLY